MCLGWPRWTRAGHIGDCASSPWPGGGTCDVCTRPSARPALPWLSPSGIDRLSNKVGSPTEEFVHARGPRTMRRHVGRRLAGQEGACG